MPFSPTRITEVEGCNLVGYSAREIGLLNKHLGCMRSLLITLLQCYQLLKLHKIWFLRSCVKIRDTVSQFTNRKKISSNQVFSQKYRCNWLHWICLSIRYAPHENKIEAVAKNWPHFCNHHPQLVWRHQKYWKSNDIFSIFQPQK